jgi:hypothetical protein
LQSCVLDQSDARIDTAIKLDRGCCVGRSRDAFGIRRRQPRTRSAVLTNP